MGAAETHRAIDAVWRIESARLIGGLTRMVRDVGLAEELAQDALVAALEQWPEAGIPNNPGAWLMAAAKHRAIDLLRRNKLIERKHEELGRDLEASHLETGIDDPIGDDLLRLMFICCHPVLSTEARVALTLRLLGGLTTAEIARAFLVPESAIAQRIVRAKRTLGEKRVPFEVPRGAEFAGRLSSVLEVVYLIFNEGYSATAGEDWMRPGLCEDALRLGRILAGLAPGEPEVHGLVALMEIQASRSRARVGPSGELIRLFDQNRALWDRLLIGRGLAALDRADKLRGVRGPYALQAAIAACHARAAAPELTDWTRIESLYSELARVNPSPVVELNRAVAVSMAQGPAAGLALVDALASEPSLAGYHLLPSVRGDLLARLGRQEEARAQFEYAAPLTQNAPERQLLLDRARYNPITQTEQMKMEINAYLTFDGNCREAMTFYQQCLGAELQLVPFSEAPPEFAAGGKDRILHAKLTKGSATLMASDTMPGMPFQQGNNFSIALDLPTLDEIEAAFAAFAAKGKVTMPLADAFWGARFGMITDQFGVRWMFNFEHVKEK